MFPPDKNSGSLSNCVFAVDLGGTHLRAAVVDSNGEIHFRLKTKTPQAKLPDEIVRLLTDAVQEAQLTIGSVRKIALLSVAVPGTVSFDEGRVITVPNLTCLENFPLGPILMDQLSYPAMVENDANAAAVGEMWRGAGRGFKNIVCVTLGTGVGGGIILDGKVWRGVDGSAGEIGHTGVDPFAGVQCKCGSEGCLEVYASATGIVRMARESLNDEPNSSLPQTENLTAEGIFRAYLEGDALATDVFERMGGYLGVGLANIINLLNPEMIIVGGGVASGWEAFQQPMQRKVVERAFPVPGSRVKIVRAECGDDAGVLGAARLAFDSASLVVE